MNLIKNTKIDKNKIIEFLIVITTLFFLLTILYNQFISGDYIFASGDYFAPKMIANSIKSLTDIYGEYPYWLPSIFGGMPTIHSLQNISNYYFPNFILNILKIFSAPEIWTQLIHLIFSGLGTYILLRFLKVDFLVSLFGSITFLMTPYMNVCIVHGHGSQIMTAAYIPWILWALLKLCEKQNIYNLGLLALFVGFQLQRGHIQIAYYTWIMAGIFIIMFPIFEYIKSCKNISFKLIPKFYYYLIAAFFFGFIMALSIIYPSYLYSEHSIRGAVQGGASFNYATGWSFSFKEMITFIIPSFFGFGGNTYWGTIEPAMTDFPNYLGIFTIIFIIYGLIKPNKNSIYLYFLSLSLFFLMLSFGKNFLLFEFLYNYLPFFNKFRVPMMALMMFQFSSIILSALGLQSFINDDKKPAFKVITFIVFLFLIFFLLFKLFFINNLKISENIIIQVKDMINFDLNKSILILFSFLFLFIFSLYNTTKKYPILISLILLSIIDIFTINHKIINQPKIKIQTSNLNELLLPLNELKKTYDIKREPFRFISQSGYYQIRNWSAYVNLEDIRGYHPAKLNNYSKFEPYLNTKIGRNFMRLLNVKKIINWNDKWEIISTNDFLDSVDRIFLVDTLVQYQNDEELLMLMNNDFFDPLKVSYTKSIVPLFSKPNSNSYVRIKKWSPNKIIIETNLEHENFVGLSEVYYPNWEITSHDVDVIQINGLIRGFVSPKGKNTIIMEFNYNDVKYASYISFLSFFIMLSFILSSFYFNNKP